MRIHEDMHTYVFIHAYTHTYIHTYIHTYRHTYIHTYIQALTSKLTHKHNPRQMEAKNGALMKLQEEAATTKADLVSTLKACEAEREMYVKECLKLQVWHDLMYT